MCAVIRDRGFWNSMVRENRFYVIDHFFKGGFSKYSNFTISQKVIYQEDEFLSFSFE